MSDWLLGDIRLPQWQRDLVAQMMKGEVHSVLVQPRPTRRQRVIADAHMVIAAMLSDQRVVFAGPDEDYTTDVQAEVERILERFGGE